MSLLNAISALLATTDEVRLTIRRHPKNPDHLAVCAVAINPEAKTHGEGAKEAEALHAALSQPLYLVNTPDVLTIELPDALRQWEAIRTEALPTLTALNALKEATKTANKNGKDKLQKSAEKAVEKTTHREKPATPSAAAPAPDLFGMAKSTATTDSDVENGNDADSDNEQE